MAGHGETLHIATHVIGGRTIECYGVRFADTPEGEFDYYELYEGGSCITEGETLVDAPNRDEVASWIGESR